MLVDLIHALDLKLVDHTAAVAAVNQKAADIKATVSEIKTEAERVPNLDDVRALIDRMAAGTAKT